MINQKSDQSAIYLLPVPISAGEDGRLGAVVYSLSQENFQNEPKLLFNLLPERILPSPSYLFAQGLDPNLLKHGLKERDFVARLRNLIKNRVIITWDAHLLNLLDVATINCFATPLLQDCKGIISIRTLLHATCLFGSLTEPPTKSLDKSATLYNLTLPNITRSPKKRLLELESLSLMIQQNQKALYDYQLRGKYNKINLLDSSLCKSTLLSCVSDDGQCGVLRILKKINNSYLGAFLNCSKDAEVRFLVLNDNGSEIIAPIGVFTKERCTKLKFNLKLACDTILNYVLPENLDYVNLISQHDSPLKKFLSSLSTDERNFYDEVCQSENIPQILGNLSLSMTRRVLLYLGDQARGHLNSTQYENYENFCRNSLQKQYRTYMHETELLVNHADENSTSDASLIHCIAVYPQTL